MIRIPVTAGAEQLTGNRTCSMLTPDQDAALLKKQTAFHIRTNNATTKETPTAMSPQKGDTGRERKNENYYSVWRG